MKTKSTIKVLALLGIILLALAAFILTRESDPEIRKQKSVEKTVQKLKSSQRFPLKVNENITFTGIEAFGLDILYAYEVNNSTKEELEKSDYILGLTDSACQNPFTKNLLSDTTSLIYSYKFSSGEKFEKTIKLSDCSGN